MIERRFLFVVDVGQQSQHKHRKQKHQREAFVNRHG